MCQTDKPPAANLLSSMIECNKNYYQYLNKLEHTGIGIFFREQFIVWLTTLSVLLAPAPMEMSAVDRTVKTEIGPTQF